MDNERFQIEEEQSVQVMRLSLPDQMDGMEVDVVIDSILHTLEGRSQNPWVLDLSDVSYMGSAMLGLMVNIRERIRQSGGKLVLCGLSTPLMRIFQTCCLERLFNITKTRPEAISLAGR